MSMRKESQALPKFGEWVNNPASANGFTVVFERARDEKKTGAYTENARSQKKYDSSFTSKDKHKHSISIKRKWLCLG